MGLESRDRNSPEAALKSTYTVPPQALATFVVDMVSPSGGVGVGPQHNLASGMLAFANGTLGYLPTRPLVKYCDPNLLGNKQVLESVVGTAGQEKNCTWWLMV